MTTENQNFKYDKRVVNLNFERKNLTKEDYDKSLENLPDLSNQVELIPAFEEEKSENEANETEEKLTFSVA